MSRSLLRRHALIIAGAIGLSLFIVPLTATAAQADGPSDGSPWVVTLGDSYISGEGGRWAGNSNWGESLVDAGGPATYFDNATHSGETVRRCHRSSSAEVYLGGGVNGLNLACSGAKTSTFTTITDYFKPGIDFASMRGGQGQAAQLQDFAANHNVTMVTLSIGGNDFDFGGIALQCVTDFLMSSSWYKVYCKDDTAATNAMSSKNVAEITAKISGALQNVRTAMRNAGYDDNSWTLMLQNYPSPLPGGSGIRYPETGYSRQYTGGCGFWDADADYASTTILPTINNALVAAANASGLTNIKVLDVAGAFNGRRLCENTVGLLEEKGLTSWRSPGASDSTEWVNQVRTVTTAIGNYYLQESFHPNYWGQLALRNCLRQAYNDGTPRSGACTPGTGLNTVGEPNMTLG